MTDKIIVEKLNEVYMRLHTTPAIREDLSEFFQFDVDNAHYYRKGRWNGKKKLFNKLTKQMYLGLLPRLEDWAKDNGVEVELAFDDFETELLINEADTFIDSLNTGRGKRDYQILGFLTAIRKHRSLLISPTASGKSLMIYYIVRYLLNQGLRGLIVVPTTALVEQMFTDFEDYSQNTSFNVDHNMHRIYGGKEKHSRKNVIITTWQSVFKMPKEYFKEYDFIIGDEAHEFKAKSLVGIMEALENATIRIGTTGTLDGKYVHQLVLEGLFGKTRKLTHTKDLIDRDILSQFTVKALHFKYPPHICKRFATSKRDYKKEMDFLFESQVRNNYITKLALSLKGNTLILFKTIAHGHLLNDMITTALEKYNRRCYMIYGATDVEIREQIRSALEEDENAILTASFGTFSRGSNVRNLKNLIFAAPVKSQTRSLQSIGRVLRKSDKKDQAILFDIGDDLRTPGGKDNYALAHFKTRLEIYTTERFDYHLYRISLRDSNNVQPNLTNLKTDNQSQ